MGERAFLSSVATVATRIGHFGPNGRSARARTLACQLFCNGFPRGMARQSELKRFVAEPLVSNLTINSLLRLS